MDYNFKEVEKKWKKYWKDNETFKTDVWDFSKPKYYALDMFPYPSGVGLHAGHVEGYTATDIIARFKRMQGYNVLHPMGWDAFGLPAEQYAITTGNHPDGFTEKNIATFKNQLENLGLSYDWSKELSTTDPNFYKWTQWIFKQLYLDGYAKLVDMPVNWCEGLGTVLANDEVIDGKSERGGFPVVRKNMKQWIIETPKFAEKLLENLENLDWPESTKEIQRNWIGKSVGAHVNFKVAGHDGLSFTVFTTRCDTLFGATYCVLAPESDLVKQITTLDQKSAVDEYIKICSTKSDLERTELNKEKTGVFTGAYAINPVNGKEIPIWISDYVLASYGTGAIMAVPAHDTRDYEFATKFNIDIIPVLEGGDISKEAFTGDGLHINSEFLNGLNKEDAISKMLNWLEENNVGHKQVNYKIRDWIFARQRYWGEPIPIVNFEDGTSTALDDSELPLVLPKLQDYAPSKNGDSPLEKATDWVNVTVNGKTRAVFTTETTAQGVANELGFKAPNYVVVGDENGSVLSGTRITIAQVTSRSLSTVDQEVAVEVVRQKDDTMAKGEEEVVQVGQPGLERVQRETLYSNGTVIKTNDVSKVTQRAMVPTIIKEGTREVTTSRNVAGRASRAIVMEASAYLAGDGDGAGITATGLPAVRGIAAVDPDVIPLGTRLFIPGYGEAIAADTGGAIVGNKIDLVMDSYGEAMDFGRQDVTVYVLD